MSTKSTTAELTKEEIKYQRRVKSVELALKASGNKGVMGETLVKMAEKIYSYLNA